MDTGCQMAKLYWRDSNSRPKKKKRWRRHHTYLILLLVLLSTDVYILLDQHSGDIVEAAHRVKEALSGKR